MRTIEHKNIPSRGGGTGFNPGSINSFITICDYDEEKKIKTTKKDTLPVFYRVKNALLDLSSFSSLRT